MSESVTKKDKELVEQALGEDSSVSRQALKQITSQNKFNTDKKLAIYTVDRLRQEPSLTEAARPDAIVRLLNYAMYGVYREDDAFSFTLEKSFEALVHPDGRVRESGRKMLGNLAFFSHGAVEWDDLLPAVVGRLEKIIKKNRPKGQLPYMEKLKPSVFKTAAIAWYDLMDHLYYKDENKFFKMVDDLGLPEYEPDDLPDFLAHKRACDYPELEPYLSKPIPAIKLKYHKSPTAKQRKEAALERGSKCAECGKDIEAIGSFNIYTQEETCDHCAIKFYMLEEGFENLKSAEAHRRRLFDVGYLFTEMMLDEYCEEVGMGESDLEDTERRAISDDSQKAYNLIPVEVKIKLQNTPDQKRMEEVLRGYL